MWELHRCENPSFPQNWSGRANFTLFSWHGNVINAQPLVSASWKRAVMEGLIFGNGSVSLYYRFLERNSNILFFFKIFASTGTNVVERKPASAAAFGRASRLLQGSRAGLHSPNTSLQTTDAGGPSARQPLGAAVPINDSRLPQSHPRTPGGLFFSKHSKVTYGEEIFGGDDGESLTECCFWLKNLKNFLEG